jgi:hypothetical protein
MYVKYNIETRSYNYCYGGKVILTTYSECVCFFLAFCMQRDMGVSHIVISGLHGSAMFFHIVS